LTEKKVPPCPSTPSTCRPSFDAPLFSPSI
jgi:hypothetical protein